ncbi:MAG: hypothetical protein H0W83_17900, partial [Planctomycetes bacterium]|nr:hypothetical protein [Planctomycetota bacterium]
MSLRPGAMALLAAVAALGCRNAESGSSSDCTQCGTVVIAATGEPSAIVPPLVMETVGRDVGDLIYERLADLSPGGAPVDTAAFRPRLASRWERIDSLDLRFHIRPGASWHDGRPVTAEDVVFSFGVYADSMVDAQARSYVANRIAVVAEDSATVRMHFAAPSAEQLYDATYHVRIIPRHVWSAIPRAGWAADTAGAHLIGSGPYRFAGWQRGQALTL